MPYKCLKIELCRVKSPDEIKKTPCGGVYRECEGGSVTGFRGGSFAGLCTSLVEGTAVGDEYVHLVDEGHATFVTLGGRVVLREVNQLAEGADAIVAEILAGGLLADAAFFGAGLVGFGECALYLFQGVEGKLQFAPGQGGTLLVQGACENLYRSTEIAECDGALGIKQRKPMKPSLVMRLKLIAITFFM